MENKTGIPDAGDTDMMSKIYKSITAIDKNYDLATYHTCLSEVIMAIQDINSEHAKLLGSYMLDFIKEKAKKLK